MNLVFGEVTAVVGLGAFLALSSGRASTTAAGKPVEPGSL